MQDGAADSRGRGAPLPRARWAQGQARAPRATARPWALDGHEPCQCPPHRVGTPLFEESSLVKETELGEAYNKVYS